MIEQTPKFLLPLFKILISFTCILYIKHEHEVAIIERWEIRTKHRKQNENDKKHFVISQNVPASIFFNKMALYVTNHVAHKCLIEHIDRSCVYTILLKSSIHFSFITSFNIHLLNVHTLLTSINRTSVLPIGQNKNH